MLVQAYIALACVGKRNTGCLAVHGGFHAIACQGLTIVDDACKQSCMQDLLANLALSGSEPSSRNASSANLTALGGADGGGEELVGMALEDMVSAVQRRVSTWS